ncbi:MAG: hypothetical protein R6V29_03935 [Spirochaetia bacterium]
MSRTLIVPGNLLLFGEYAVLEQGGLGLACATGPHVRAYLDPAEGFTVEGRLGARAATWTAGEECNSPEDFLCRVAGFAQRWCGERNIDIAALNTRLVIDSTAFMSESGHKRGLGSSAAATVALCAVVCDLAGIDDDATRFDLAVRAHRYAQGGRGSGYDVAVSYFGGLGLFRGGERPEFEPVSLEWLPPLSLYETGAPSSTSHAVSHYAAWKAAHREEARAFLERSNNLISRLVDRQTWSDARPIAGELAELGKSLGRSIGVSADISPAVSGLGRGVNRGGAGANRSDTEGAKYSETEVGAIAHAENTDLCKAVGAGAELAVCFGSAKGDESSELSPVEIDWEGCTWR